MVATYSLIAEWLARFTYKPQWHVSALCEVFNGDGPTIIFIVARVESAYHPGVYTNVSRSVIVPPFIETEEAFFDWIHFEIGSLEMHEIDEWFRVDGIQTCDPHVELHHG